MPGHASPSRALPSHAKPQTFFFCLISFENHRHKILNDGYEPSLGKESLPRRAMPSRAPHYQAKPHLTVFGLGKKR